MSTMIYKKETTTMTDSDGNQQQTSIETAISKDPEDDYIKLYTKTWCEFNNIPIRWRELFLELACLMTYCNSENLEMSQLVYTGKPFNIPIMNKLGWKIDMYKKGISELCKCGAIKRKARGVYQINPTYAGKGPWKYNPHLKHGGVKDLRATFDFVNKTCKSEIVWADDGNENAFNEMYRNGLQINKSDLAIMQTQTLENNVCEHT